MDAKQHKTAVGVLALGCFGGLLYLTSLVSAYAVSRAEAQIATPASGPFGNVYSSGTFQTQVGSGSNGFACTTNGCRFDIGAGANDYLSSNGTVISTPATLQGLYVNATGALSTDEIFDYSGLSSVTVGGAVPDGASAVGVVLKSRSTLSTAGSKIAKFVNNSTEKAYIDKDGAMQLSGAKSRGTITLAAGTGTATVLSGAVCICTDTTANASVKCAVASTTLTATGTGTDVVAYICL